MQFTKLKPYHRTTLTMLAVIAVLAVSACGNESNVRQCLKEHAAMMGGQDHVYLTKVVNVEVWQSYPDGTATRFVKYRVQGSNETRSATCRW